MKNRLEFSENIKFGQKTESFLTYVVIRIEPRSGIASLTNHGVEGGGVPFLTCCIYLAWVHTLDCAAPATFLSRNSGFIPF